MAGELGERVDGIAQRAKANREAAAALVAAEQADMLADRERKRALFREQMPHVAGLVDMFREHGMEVRVLMAEENGHRVTAKGYRE